MYKINIKGYLKTKGEPGLEEFYNMDELGTISIGRRYLQMVMDENQSIMEIGYNRKIITLYKFEISFYTEGKLTKFKKVAYFRNDDEWKVLGKSEKVFDS
jgi:hypothetical protein